MTPFQLFEALQKYTLRVPIEKRWADLIISGHKPEEYRDATHYWNSRICVRGGRTRTHDCSRCDLNRLCKRKVQTNKKWLMLHNYRGHIATFKIESIKLGIGDRALGASGELQFIIKIGDRTDGRK